jgi:hypothetical protein
MTPSTPRPDVPVRFTATVEPSLTDRMRYEAGSVWTVPAARADALFADGLAEPADAPSAVPEILAAGEEE